MATTISFIDCINRTDLNLPDEEKLKLDVIWIGETHDGSLTLWQVCDDDAAPRRDLGIPPKA